MLLKVAFAVVVQFTLVLLHLDNLENLFFLFLELLKDKSLLLLLHKLPNLAFLNNYNFAYRLHPLRPIHRMLFPIANHTKRQSLIRLRRLLQSL